MTRSVRNANDAFVSGGDHLIIRSCICSASGTAEELFVLVVFHALFPLDIRLIELFGVEGAMQSSNSFSLANGYASALKDVQIDVLWYNPRCAEFR